MKKITIKRIKDANITKEDNWVDVILDEITDKFARGYLTAKTEQLSDIYSHSDEGFKDNFLEYCDYDIWGK